MACITLTRVALSHAFAALPATGWEVAFEGQHVATYAEERDGWLRQIGSFGLDALLRSHGSTWDPAKGYPNPDALRDAYVRWAKAWEERRDGMRRSGQ